MRDQTPSYRDPTPPPPAYVVGPEVLSVRELEVLGAVASGLSNKEIAESLLISINTVKTYIRTGYRKIGVTTRAQAVLWAAQHGQLKIPGVTIIVNDALMGEGPAPGLPAG